MYPMFKAASTLDLDFLPLILFAMVVIVVMPCLWEPLMKQFRTRRAMRVNRLRAERISTGFQRKPVSTFATARVDRA